MRIGIPAEIYPGETRVAATPETVKKLMAGGRHSVVVQSGAGQGAFGRQPADGLRVAAAGITAFALELLPRITRAQTMDVLSSQGNIAGYKAVLVAVNEYGRFAPMLMTAAGTVKAAPDAGPSWRV